MVATVVLAEYNGAGETLTDSITNLNYGAADEPNQAVGDHPITVGQNSYDKYVKVHVSAMGGSNKIKNLQIWISNLGGGWKTGEGIQVSLETSSYTQVTYATPSQTTYSHLAAPEADPGGANLGIGGALAGELTAAGYSDYWRSQLQSTGSTPVGNNNIKTWTIQYDEE